MSFALYIDGKATIQIDNPEEAYVAFDDAVEQVIRHGYPTDVELTDRGQPVAWYSGKGDE